jgi:hypothetical protein
LGLGHWFKAVGYALAIDLSVVCGCFLALLLVVGLKGNEGLYRRVKCSYFMVDLVVKFSKSVRTGKTKNFSKSY